MKQKLIELLKTVPEIKKDIEELRFGCVVQYNKGAFYKFAYKPSRPDRFYYLISIRTGAWVQEWDNEFIEKYTIIGNPLEERHLRMYFGKELVIRGDDMFTNPNENGDYLDVMLDNTKSFNDQAEEVYGDIVKFLEV